MFYYSLTVKCNKKGVGETVQELDMVLQDILVRTEASFLRSTYEGGPNTDLKLHLHSYFSSPNKLKYTDYKKRGWMIYFRRVYEHTGWFKYMQKDLLDHDVPPEGDYLFVD